MGFLNIMGGIAAGAQRADELEAKAAASKTKGETVADKLVGEIIKKRWLTSDEAMNKKITAKSLGILSREGDVDTLRGYLASATEYEEKLKSTKAALESKTTIEKDGGFASFDSNTNKLVSFGSIPNTFKEIGGKEQTGSDQILNARSALQLFNKRVDQFKELTNHYGGYKNTPQKEIERFIRFAYGGLDIATSDVRGIANERFSLKYTDPEKLMKGQFPFAFDAKGNHIDENKTKALAAIMQEYAMFGNFDKKRLNKVDVEVLSPAAAKTASKDPEITVVPYNKNEDYSKVIPTNVQPIVHAKHPDNINNTASKNSTDGYMNRTLYGTVAIHDAVVNVLQTKGKSRKALGNLAERAAYQTSDAEQVTEGAGAITFLDYMYRNTHMPKRRYKIMKTRTGDFLKIPVDPPPVETKILEFERSTTDKLTKSQGTINSTLRQIDYTQSIFMDMGVNEILRKTEDTQNHNDILNRLGLSLTLQEELQDRELLDSGGGASRQQLRAAFNTLRARVDGLSPSQKAAIEREGAAALSKLPAAISNLYETIISNMKGLLEMVSPEKIENLRNNFFSDDDGKIAARTGLAFSKFKDKEGKGGYTFTGLINGEEERLREYKKTIEETEIGSQDRLRAEAAARLSFAKIQLAYTYAAIAQGGEGSARTISDTDFANSLLSLFQSQGPAVTAIMSDIEGQLEVELEAINALVEYNGTGQLTNFKNLVTPLGREVNRVNKIKLEEDRRTKRIIDVEPIDSSDVEESPSDTTGEEDTLNLGATRNFRSLAGTANQKQGDLIEDTIKDEYGEDVPISYRIAYVDNSTERENDFRRNLETLVAPALYTELQGRKYFDSSPNKESLNTQKAYNRLQDIFLNDPNMVNVLFYNMILRYPKGIKINVYDDELLNQGRIPDYHTPSAESIADILHAASISRYKQDSEKTLSDNSAEHIANNITQAIITYMYQNFDRVKERAERDRG
tara:strand:- start:4775 stop:7672 length:2898 start_codon:yes stop_codon:yes gene_type:complete